MRGQACATSLLPLVMGHDGLVPLLCISYNQPMHLCEPLLNPILSRSLLDYDYAATWPQGMQEYMKILVSAALLD